MVVVSLCLVKKNNHIIRLQNLKVWFSSFIYALNATGNDSCAVAQPNESFIKLLGGCRLWVHHRFLRTYTPPPDNHSSPPLLGSFLGTNDVATPTRNEPQRPLFPTSSSSFHLELKQPTVCVY